MRSLVVEFCTEIGTDPLMVQGSGGNVSWKEEGILWVKASGTWLADAKNHDIFVAVDLINLQNCINQGDFSTVPTLQQASDLKPSIETILHALIPAKVVVHLHSVDILACLVRTHCDEELAFLLGNQFNFTTIDYCKPGPELAVAMHNMLVDNVSSDVFFLKNHGVVITGASISDIRLKLCQLTTVFYTLTTKKSLLFTQPTSEISDYFPIADIELHRLALENHFFSLLHKNWALYPDHVVFLGEKAITFQSWDELRRAISLLTELPKLVFIKNQGVFVSEAFSKADLAQLRCYYDILARQPKGAELHSLSTKQIYDLLHWDAEKYRMSLSRERG